MPQHIFLFDIDGTLLLTGGAGKIAFNRVFEELFQEQEIWQDVHPDGRTDDSLIDEVFTKRFNRLPTADERMRVTRRYNDVLAEELPRSERFRLMPKAIEVLTDLAAHTQHTLGLATGNFESAAWHKLRHAKLDHYFGFGGFGSDSHDRQELTKRALERGLSHAQGKADHIWLIGDSIHDIRCGLGIGATTIGVCTGSTPAADLHGAGAHHVLNDLSEFDLKNLSKKL